MGIGGIGIGDLDMAASDAADNLVGKDTADDNIPVVDVMPKADQTYTFGLKVQALDPGVADADYYFAWVVAFKRP